MVVEKIGMKEYYRHSSFFFLIFMEYDRWMTTDQFGQKKNISDKVTRNQYTSKLLKKGICRRTKSIFPSGRAFCRRARGMIFGGGDNKMRLRYFFGDMIFTGRPHKVPPAKSYFF